MKIFKIWEVILKSIFGLGKFVLLDWGDGEFYIEGCVLYEL